MKHALRWTRACVFCCNAPIQPHEQSSWQTRAATAHAFDYDYVIIGSGFGGSVSALRLSEKGYKVLVLEKGMRLGAADFPKSNWDLKRWLWLPSMNCFGLFKLTFFRHVERALRRGRGRRFARLRQHPAGTEEELLQLRPPGRIWPTGRRSCSRTTRPPCACSARRPIRAWRPAISPCANSGGRSAWSSISKPTQVSVFFGKPAETVPDPYFGGKGPERAGCIFCGGCMTGCRHNAKNSLDKNYLYLAEQLGAVIQPESLVTDVRPLGAADGADGYAVDWQPSATRKGAGGTVRCRGVVFAGGVLGTVELMLQLKQTSLPRLSERLGYGVRTNSEALIPVTVPDGKSVFSDGVAIGSILHTDEHSHLEPVRYAAGSGFWRLVMGPRVYHPNGFVRLLKLLGDWLLHPVMNLKVLFVDDWAKRTQVLLFMQTVDSTLRMVRGRFGLATRLDVGPAPTAFMPEAHRPVRALRRDRRRQAGGDGQRNPARHSVDRAHPRRRLHGARRRRGRHRQRQPRVRLPQPVRLRRLDDLGQPRRQPVAVDHRDQRARDEQGAAARGAWQMLYGTLARGRNNRPKPVAVLAQGCR